MIVCVSDRSRGECGRPLGSWSYPGLERSVEWGKRPGTARV
jgi:hypothetical protein